MTARLINSLFGGMLIGAGVAVLLLLDGRVAGISGILDGVLRGAFGEHAWRLAFLVGLVAPAAVVGLGDVHVTLAPTLALAAGLLVGVGTRLGSGCTSGHGVCGIANLAPRSLLATALFMAAAMLTVFVVRHVPGPWHS